MFKNIGIDRIHNQIISSLMKNFKGFFVFRTQNDRRRGESSFTLVELLVVIGILAILTAAVVVVLNPAQLIAQSRDTTRFSDMESINKALSLYQTDGGSSFGNSNTVYVSIPDTSTSCANLGLAPLPSGWNYACVTAANLQKTNGTGWIPVNFNSVTIGAPLSALPTDPVNSTSTNNFYTYITSGSNWTVSAQTLESAKYASRAQKDGGTSATAYEVGSSLALAPYVFPSNWVKVPGNSTFGTSDFYVMKYDAKCIQASNSAPLTSPDTGYHTYSNTSQPCVGPSYYIASSPGGYPIANIFQTDAASYCTSIGAHLITNNEWQTIAWNAQNVSSNWLSGSVGTGYIYSGHNDNAPAYALTADSNDANGYFGETNTGDNQRRTLTLSNGSVVWDMAGNVWQWTNNTIIGTNEPHGSATGWNWNEYTAITTWGSMTQATVGPLNVSWNSGNGVGMIYSENASDATTYGFIRGGSWLNGGRAGVEALGLHVAPGVQNGNVGFRCSR
jgi:formylglycine-generating enzyme required for sulfatase activity/Tfp pilus assembly protein PilE